MFILLFFHKSGGAIRWRVCYNWGLPSPVLTNIRCIKTGLVVVLKQFVAGYSFWQFNNVFKLPGEANASLLVTFLTKFLIHPLPPKSVKCPMSKSHPSNTRHWARSNSRYALSHQLKQRGSQDVQNICKTEKVSYNDFMDDPWCPSHRSWTKDSVGDVFKLLSISEPGRNVNEHFRSLTNMWKVDFF